jgi:hypothetical protein
MTESHEPPDAGNALPGLAAEQLVPAPSPTGPATPQRTSPIAIASTACGTGALVLSVTYLALMFNPRAYSPGGSSLGLVVQLLGICACPAAIVLGIVALVQIRRTRRRGTGLAVAGMVLGCAVPVLWLVLIVVAMGIACQPPHGC